MDSNFSTEFENSESQAPTILRESIRKIGVVDVEKCIVLFVSRYKYGIRCLDISAFCYRIVYLITSMIINTNLFPAERVGEHAPRRCRPESGEHPAGSLDEPPTGAL